MDQEPKRSAWVWGSLMMLTGAVFLAAYQGLIDLDLSVVQPPRVILLTVSVIAFAGGLLIIVRRETRLSELLAGALLFALAAVGGWAAIFGPADRISGGLGFLPPETNVVLARGVFGMGAIICLIMSAYAFRRSREIDR
jgi:hypothetical protein